MFKAILLAVIAACGVPSTPSPATAEHPDVLPPDQPLGDEGQNFCCGEVDDDGKSGKNCSAIGKESINSCDNVLYCEGGYHKKDGKVYCKDGKHSS